MAFDFDLFTIGAGSGGVAASRRAASYGARVAICEGSRVGGTCVIRGCVPKKLLVYGGQFRDAFEDAVGFGWRVTPPEFDWATLRDNKDREIDRLNQVYISMLERSGVKLMADYGQLIDDHTVEVSGQRFSAGKILIATGGRPVLPPIPGMEHAITSNEALELATLPEAMTIIGGGYIAIEFASIFNALGVAVTMMVRGDAPLRGFDGDIRAAVSRELRARGIDLRTGTRPVAVTAAAAGFVVHAQDGTAIPAGQVMAATGRSPNTRGLGLDDVGVAVDGQGAVMVDGWSRTSAKTIYAIGDVTNRIQLTPVAIAEGRAFAETHFNENPMQVDYANIPTAVFATPPVGTVGLSEDQARAQGHEVDIYRSRFRPMKNTLSGRDEQTLMKLVVDRTSDRVLGCHMVGVDAPEIVQGLAIALNCGATKRQFDRTIGLHPSAAEEFVTMRDKVPAPAPVSAPA
ncbi:MAG: glutathione-disulfide reductase [Azospirillaceae bacterium]|nr:glutathione-disulfide reductase [Azospirillaceae bacterium]